MPGITKVAIPFSLAAALTLIGCGGNSVTGPTGPGGASGDSGAASTQRVGLLDYNDPTATGTAGNPNISCPSDALRIFHAGVYGRRLELQWQGMQNVTRYEVQAEQLNNNTFLPLSTQMVSEGTLAEIYAPGSGTYRLRVRSASATCSNEASWSDWMVLSVDDPPSPGYWDDSTGAGTK